MNKKKRVRIRKAKSNKKKNNVRGLNLGEVSFVDKGDNPGAHMLLMKRKTITTQEVLKSLPSFLQDWVVDAAYDIDKQGASEFLEILKSMEASTFAEIEDEKEIRESVFDRIWTLERSIGSILEDDDVTDKTSMIQQSVIEFQQSIMEVIKQGGKQMNELEKLLAQLKKENPDMSGQDLMKKAAETMVEKNETLSKEKEDLEKEKGNLTKEKEDLEKKVEDLEKGDPKEAKIDKSQLPEAVVKQLEFQEAALEKQAKDLKKMQDKARTEEFTKRAGNISSVGKVEDVADMLKQIDEHDSELATEVEKVLASAHTIITKSPMFKEIGGSGENDGATAADQLDSLAKDLQKADANLTYAQAFQKVYTDSANTEIVKQYRAERN